MTDVRITQLPVEVVQQDDAIDVRLTQLPFEVVQREDVDVRLTQMVIEIVHSGDCPDQPFTPSVCPGDTDGRRGDGLPYTPTDPAACAGSGATGGARTGQ